MRSLAHPVRATTVAIVVVVAALFGAGAAWSALGAGSDGSASFVVADQATDLPQMNVWNRLNNDQSNPAPEHERLSCSRGLAWSCHYDKVPEPQLNFQWDNTSGDFVGADVTSTWECPAWFPASICANVTRVAAGTMTIVRADGISFSGPFELILTHAGADAQVLHVYWPVFGFSCPWFRKFSQALAANPMPLPFNGSDWPGQDCIFAS